MAVLSEEGHACALSDYIFYATGPLGFAGESYSEAITNGHELVTKRLKGDFFGVFFSVYGSMTLSMYFLIPTIVQVMTQAYWYTRLWPRPEIQYYLLYFSMRNKTERVPKLNWR